MNRKQIIKIATRAARMCDKFLKSHQSIPYDCVFLDEDYDFFDDEADAIGLFEYGMTQEHFEDGEIWIAFNINYFDNLNKGENVEEAILTTIFHEMGHGIYGSYAMDIEDDETILEGNEWLREIFFEDDEEDVVEEFAWALYDNDGSGRLLRVIRFFEDYYNDNVLESIIKESVNGFLKENVARILNEIGDTERGQEALGAASARRKMRQMDINNNTPQGEECPIDDELMANDLERHASSHYPFTMASTEKGGRLNRAFRKGHDSYLTKRGQGPNIYR